LPHHTFFFDGKLDESLSAAFEEHVLEERPVFYVSSTSRVDPATAPEGGSALFILVPISYRLNGTDTQQVRDSTFDSIISWMERELGPLRADILYKRDYGPSDFIDEFHSFRGNAFGHANLLSQSLVFKPSMDSLLSNFVFAGQLTNPGPGVPPTLASGSTAARLLRSKLHPPWLNASSVCLGMAVALPVFRCVFPMLDFVTTPFIVLVATWHFCENFATPVSYAVFHLIFTLPAMVGATCLARFSAPSNAYFHLACRFAGALCIIATLWTSPWDNYMVFAGVWSYPASSVMGVIGFVPLEEYAFFSIQTFSVCMVWVWLGRVDEIPEVHTQRQWRILGLIALAALFGAGCWMLTMDLTFYLGLITVWSSPILAIEWAGGADALVVQTGAWLRPFLLSWVYLCFIDRCAIRNGCWSINHQFSLPRFDWLPVEETYFFLVTTLMCTWFVQLMMNIFTLDCDFFEAVRRVHHWSNKPLRHGQSAWSINSTLFASIVAVAAIAVFYISG